jgi:Flp pilus assembly protein TadG
MNSRRLADDRGAITVFVVVIAASLLLGFGLVVDGGVKLAAVERADSIAAQAARAGAQAINTSTLRATGQARIDPAAAANAARSYLASIGVQGQVVVDPSAVTVDVTIRRSTKVLGLIGINNVVGHGHAQARLAPGIATDEGTS